VEAVGRQREVAPGPTAAGDARVRIVVRPTLRRVLNATVVVAGLGYFVDVYDLLLFSILRVPSLQGLGVADVTGVGIVLLNAQMAGLLVGGIAWGVLGDKRGRVSVLFGSILLYSLANLANAFVANTTEYAVLRFVAGVGLAGELGAGVTLVTEVMPRETRGWGTALVSGLGILGGVTAALVGTKLAWRWAFIVGGCMGLALLAARLRLADSAMFTSASAKASARGDLRALVRSPGALRRFGACVLIGLPLWFVVGIVLTFSPEIGRELGVTGALAAGTAVAVGYAGATLGSLASGALSERLKSRRKALAVFFAATAVLTAALLSLRGASPAAFYATSFALGIAVGYWAVFMVTSAEQFGTNLRATVTTSVPNLVRGGVVPLTLGVTLLRTLGLGLVASASVVGALVFAAAGLAVWLLPETYGRELDFVEA
jgi:MFS family permease